MKKAKSRLAPPATQVSPTPVVPALESISVKNKVGAKVEPGSQIKSSSQRQKKLTWLSARFKHWPTLVIGLVFTSVLLGLVWLVPPTEVKSWLLPNAYLPFFICLMGASFFLLSFIFLDSVAGLWWTLLLVSLVFLRFQQVVFTWPIVGLFLLTVVLGGIYQWWRRRR